MLELITTDSITAVGSIATPVLVLIIGNRIWKHQNTIERRIKLEENLRDDRIEIYNQVLEPYILVLTKIENNRNTKTTNKGQNNEAVKLMKSLKYRKACFQIVLKGSDDVVSSHNQLRQHFYNLKEDNQDIVKTMLLLGDFLLEIRKSVGNEATKLKNLEMMEWLITDIKDYQDNTKTSRVTKS